MISLVFMKALGGFFAVMNPFTALPIFLAMTDSYTPQQRRKSALRILLYTTIMCTIFMLSGEALLNVFGIKIDDFQLAGGIVLLTIALGMLHGGGSATSEGSQKEQAEQAEVAAAANDVSFYPMTFPMIVGPGTITTIVVLSASSHTVMDHVAVGAALALIVAATGLILFFANEIGRLMSTTLRTIMSRLMGMILAAIAVEMMAEAALSLFPSLR